MPALNKKALVDTLSIAHMVIDNTEARNSALSDHENDQLEGKIAEQVGLIITLLENAGFKFQEKNAGSKIGTLENGFEVILMRVITDIQADTEQKINQILADNEGILNSNLKKIITNLDQLYQPTDDLLAQMEGIQTMQTQRLLLDEMKK